MLLFVILVRFTHAAKPRTMVGGTECPVLGPIGGMEMGGTCELSVARHKNRSLSTADMKATGVE